MNSATPGQVPRGQVWIYGSLTFATALLLVPMGTVLPNFYAEYTSLSLGTIGAIIGAGRILDAVLDPVVGTLVDRTRSPIGPFKPWILGGSVLLAAGAYMLFSPPAASGATYLAVWHTLTMIGWACVYIPYVALGAALSSDYGERSSIVAVRTVFGLVGSLLFLALPFVSGAGSTEIGPQVMHTAGLLLAVTVPLVALVLVLRLKSATRAVGRSLGWSTLARILRDNPVFRRYAYTKLLYGLGGGMYAASSIVYVSSQLDMAPYVPHMLLLSIAVGLASIPLWLAAVRRFGKHRALAVSGLAFALTLPGILAVPAGEPGLWPLLAYVVLSGFMNGAAPLAPPAILADIVDYGEWRLGDSSPGSYFAIESLIEKANGGIGAAAALLLLDAAGYRIGAVNDGSALTGLQMAAIWAPMTLLAASAVLWWHFPLTEGAQRAIRRRLERRSAASGYTRTETPASSSIRQRHASGTTGALAEPNE